MVGLGGAWTSNCTNMMMPVLSWLEKLCCQLREKFRNRHEQKCRPFLSYDPSYLNGKKQRHILEFLDPDEDPQQFTVVVWNPEPHPRRSWWRSTLVYNTGVQLDPVEYGTRCARVSWGVWGWVWKITCLVQIPNKYRVALPGKSL